MAFLGPDAPADLRFRTPHQRRLLALEGFMSESDYNLVCSDMRLTDGTVWPIPITLDFDEEFAAQVELGESIALCDPEGVMLASM